MSAPQSVVGRTVRHIGRFIAGIIGQIVHVIVHDVILRGLRYIEQWLTGDKHARYGLAVTRMLLALTGIGLLLANYRTRLYTFASGSAWNGEAAQPISDFPKIWLFSGFHRLALHDGWFTVAYLALLVLAILLLVGWHTKIVLPIYWVGWVSFIEMNDMVGDQGYNMYRIVLLTLMFADTAGRWSLDARRRRATDRQTGWWLKRKWRGEAVLPGWITTPLHNLAIVVVTCHVCFVYASGSLFKAGGVPWQTGYAIYNPLHVARFSPWPELADLISWAPLVTAISWSSIILQMCFPLALTRRVTRVIALIGILSFHLGIAVLLGLPWFSLAMIAIDAIFVRDVTWRHMADAVTSTWRQSDIGAPPAIAGGDPVTVRAVDPAPVDGPDRLRHRAARV